MEQQYESPEAAKQALEDQSIIDHLLQAFSARPAMSEAETIAMPQDRVSSAEFCEQIRRTETHAHDVRTLLRGD